MGTDGELLRADVVLAWLAMIRALILVSGTHRAEGFAGLVC